MAWLGSGLSEFTDKLSNFTKDVLTEDEGGLSYPEQNHPSQDEDLPKWQQGDIYESEKLDQGDRVNSGLKKDEQPPQDTKVNSGNLLHKESGEEKSWQSVNVGTGSQGELLSPGIKENLQTGINQSFSKSNDLNISDNKESLGETPVSVQDIVNQYGATDKGQVLYGSCDKSNNHAKIVQPEANNKYDNVSAASLSLQEANNERHGDKKQSNDDGKIASEEAESAMQKLERERCHMMSVMNEKSRECSQLKAEVHQLMSAVSAGKSRIDKLMEEKRQLEENSNEGMQGMSKETIINLSRIIRDKDEDIEALKMKNSTLNQLLQESNKTEKDEQSTMHVEQLMQDRDNFQKQIRVLHQDRERLISIINQKHKENVDLYAEVQKVQEKVANDSNLQLEYEALQKRFEEKQNFLVQVQNELASSRGKLIAAEKKANELHEEVLPSSVTLSPSSSLQDLTHKNIALEESLKLKEAQSAELRTRIEEGRILLTEKEKMICCQDEALSEKNKALTELNSSVHQGEETIHMMDLEIKQLQKQVESLNFQLQGAMSEADDGNKQKMLFEDERTHLKTQIAQLKDANVRLTTTLSAKDLEINSLKEKNSTLVTVIQNEDDAGEEKGSMDARLVEVEAMEKQAVMFREERDQAWASLQSKQWEYSEMQQKLSLAEERNAKLTRELNRLREHLVSTEDSYTQEALMAEEREKELRTRLTAAEEKALSSSTAVKSASEQASMEVKEVRMNLLTMTEQRDQALVQLSEMQDTARHYATSLQNLQIVLEQFTRDRENKQSLEMERMNLELEAAIRNKDEALQQVVNLQEQLADTNMAMDAAQRLSEQLDHKEELIALLREEVQIRDSELHKTEEKFKSLAVSSEGKVDKALMKNLLMGYFHAQNKKRAEVIDIFGKVLDIHHEEVEKMKAAVAGTSSGWISGIFSRSRTTSTHESPISDVNTSFYESFVNFLEKESLPETTGRYTHAAKNAQKTDNLQMQGNSSHSKVNPFATPLDASISPLENHSSNMFLRASDNAFHLTTASQLSSNATPSIAPPEPASSSSYLRDILKQ